MSDTQQARKDVQTTTDDGQPRYDDLPHGLRVRELPTHIDDRGQVFEIFDLRWEFHPRPLVFVYQFTVRPGVIKGWGLHKKHEDRYCLLYGEIEVIFYDPREDSPTYGQVSRLTASEYERKLFNIPIGVWHAVRNIGNKDAIVLNMPTIPYNHKDPDKYRLPLDTDQIPYRFDNPVGW